MENSIEYVFPSENLAYRFLNSVKHFDADGLKVKYGRSDRYVFVRYRYVMGEFDATLSHLDDLARELDGNEAA